MERPDEMERQEGRRAATSAKANGRPRKRNKLARSDAMEKERELEKEQEVPSIDEEDAGSSSTATKEAGEPGRKRKTRKVEDKEYEADYNPLLYGPPTEEEQGAGDVEKLLKALTCRFVKFRQLCSPARLSLARRQRIAHALGLGRDGKKVGTYAFTKHEEGVISEAMKACRLFYHRGAMQALRARHKRVLSEPPLEDKLAKLEKEIAMLRRMVKGDETRQEDIDDADETELEE